jgi:hypothetical protein
MSEQSEHDRQRSRANIRLALVLGGLAFALFIGSIVKMAMEG